MHVAPPHAKETAAVIVGRLDSLVRNGRLPARVWSITGPEMPLTGVEGAATYYMTRVGESDITLRHFQPFRGTNHDWIYSLTVERDGRGIFHAVDDSSSNPLGTLVAAVVELCRPDLTVQTAKATADLEL